MPLVNQISGPPAAVLAAVLRGGPAYGQRNRATFSTSNYPDLPSLITDVVALSTSGVLDADIDVTGVLTSNGWATQAVVSVATAYGPVPPNVAVVLCNATSAPFTVTLPDATGPGYVTGQRYTLIKTDATANAATIACSAGQLISGAATASLASAYAYISVVFDGANWQVWSATQSSAAPTGAAGWPPSGATAETFPRVFAQTASSAPTSGTLYVMAFGLPGGLVVNHLTFSTKSAGTGGSAVTHAWYVLLDSNLIVRAVSSDQAGSTSFMSAVNTPYTLSTNAYTIPTAGQYYAGVMVANGTMPTFAIAGNAATNLVSAAPTLCGSSSTAQTTAPAAGATMATINSNANFSLYAYTS